MTDILIAPGWDVPLEDLLPIDPQPASPGMLPTRRQDAASGKVIDELYYVPLQFGVFEDEDQYQSVLDQFGLLDTDDLTAPISIYCQDMKYRWVIRNGVAVLPEVGSDGQRDFFLTGFTILVKQLRAQS